MSRLYNIYLYFKKQNSQTIYLFKSGIFFIALDKDAYILSNTFNLKLGKLTDSTVKCGFPCSSLNKYVNLFKSHNLTFKIIQLDNNTLYTLNEYVQNQAVLNLLNFINSIDVNNLSISEAYKAIEDIKNKVIEIDNIGAK